MAFDDQVREQASQILNEEWNLRDGQVVPKTNDVAHKNGAVRLDATFLYADLVPIRDSSSCAMRDPSPEVTRHPPFV